MNKGIAIARQIAEEDLELLKQVLKDEEDDWETLKNAIQPIMDAWEEYIETRQSVTIGSGETTICIKARHIQQLIAVWRHVTREPSFSRTTSASKHM